MTFAQVWCASLSANAFFFTLMQGVRYLNQRLAQRAQQKESEAIRKKYAALKVEIAKKLEALVGQIKDPGYKKAIENTLAAAIKMGGVEDFQMIIRRVLIHLEEEKKGNVIP